MTRPALVALLSIAFAAPAVAQPMDHASMPGMSMPAQKAKPPAKLKAARPAIAKRPAALRSPAGHDMSKMPEMATPAAPNADPHAGHDMAPVGPPAVAETETLPPPVPMDHAADRTFDPAVMASARAQLDREHGGGTYSMVMASLAEYQARSGGDGYRWDGEAWFGGDIHRVVVRSEGEGDRRGGVTAAEVQGLYSRAVGPYFNLQAGVRHDFQPRPSRTFATVGIEGLAPYWFDVQAAVFLSNKGELLGRAEATYDLRLTQRLFLQPRVELNLAAQNTPEIDSGSGLSNAELGLRLRYEITREFAPYVGVSYDRRFGKTADYRRLAGEGAADTSLVLGVRAWF